MEEDTSNSTTPIDEIEETGFGEFRWRNFKLEEAYLLFYCVSIIIINFFFIYVIVRNNLNRSPFYLTLLHVSIYGTVYTACGTLATAHFGIPNYGYHIFTNSKHIAISFQTVLFTIFIFDWFIKSEYHARNIIVVFWIVTISFIFLGFIAVSCGDRLFYSFYILTFLSFTVILATLLLSVIFEFKKIRSDVKRKTRMLLVFIYVLCFLPYYLLLIFDIHLYYYNIVDFMCPILMYGHSFINIAFIVSLDSYLRLHIRKICKRSKAYQQNSHFPVDSA